MNQSPMGFFKCIFYVILECLTCVMSEHLQKVQHDALAKGVPAFGGSFTMNDSINVLPSSVSHLGLDYFPPMSAWLFIGKNISFEFECLCSFHSDSGLTASTAFAAFLNIDLATKRALEFVGMPPPLLPFCFFLRLQTCIYSSFVSSVSSFMVVTVSSDLVRLHQASFACMYESRSVGVIQTASGVLDDHCATLNSLPI